MTQKRITVHLKIDCVQLMYLLHKVLNSPIKRYNIIKTMYFYHWFVSWIKLAISRISIKKQKNNIYSYICSYINAIPFQEIPFPFSFSSYGICLGYGRWLFTSVLVYFKVDERCSLSICNRQLGGERQSVWYNIYRERSVHPCDYNQNS